MAELKLLKERLTEAETALHQLMTGTLEVTVSIGGFGATTYAQTDINKLNLYISRLKAEIAAKEGRARRRPMLIRF